MKDFKAMISCNPILKGFKAIVFEFDDLPTAQTDQMIMVRPFVDGFVPGPPIGKFSLGGQAQAGQKLECPIDGRVTDLRIHPDHLGVDLSQVLMPGGIEEDIEDLCALTGGLKPFFGNQNLESIRLHGRPLIEIEIQFHFKGTPPFCQYPEPLRFPEQFKIF